MLSFLSDTVFQKIKEDYLQRKTDLHRIRAMHILRDVVFPFLLESFAGEAEARGADAEMTEEDLTDARLTLINDLVLELFAKVRDIYCVLESLNIIKTHILGHALKNSKIREQMFTADFVTKLLTSVSSPNLHVPSYNYKTRSLVYQIYEQFTLERQHLLAKVDDCLYISCVMSAVEGEGDPRNLLYVFELQAFILQSYCQASSKIEENQLEMFIEDIFEKVSCYFPINFTPPKNDVFKISPAQLKEGLKACFLASGHRQWLENVFPFVLDKLTAV